MGKTCKLKDVSFQCMTKFTTNKKKKKKRKKNYIITANKQYTMITWNSFQELKNFNRKYISSIHQKKNQYAQTATITYIYIYVYTHKITAKLSHIAKENDIIKNH